MNVTLKHLSIQNQGLRLESETFFNLASLYYRQGHFQKSLKEIEAAMESALGTWGKLSDKSQKDELDKLREGEEKRKCIQATRLCLRFYAEMEEFEKIEIISQSLKSLNLNKYLFYPLGLCAFYKKDFKTAEALFEEGLSKATCEKNFKDQCENLAGLTFLALAKKDLKQAQNLSQKINSLMSQTLIPDLKLLALLIHGYVLSARQKHLQAFKVFGQCYGLLKNEKNFYLFVPLMLATGTTLINLKEFSMGLAYLEQAKSACHPKYMKKILHHVKASLVWARKQKALFNSQSMEHTEHYKSTHYESGKLNKAQNKRNETKKTKTHSHKEETYV